MNHPPPAGKSTVPFAPTSTLYSYNNNSSGVHSSSATILTVSVDPSQIVAFNVTSAQVNTGASLSTTLYSK